MTASISSFPGSRARTLATAIRLAFLGLCWATALHDNDGLQAGERWDPIDPADLAATESKSSPGADAEVLFYRCRVTDERKYTDIAFEMRVKIYTQKGVEERGEISWEYSGESTVRNLAARLVKPDGTMVEFGRPDFMVSEVLRRSRIKKYKMSFVVPGVEPGDIVEYRWVEASPNAIASFWEYCQERIPVRASLVSIEANDAVGLRLTANCLPVAEQERKGGRVAFRFENLPAFVEEPLMVPWRDVRGWVGVQYGGDESDDKDIQTFNLNLDLQFREKSNPSGKLKAKTRALLEGANSDEEKLQRLYDFCQNSVTNFDYYESEAIQDEARKRARYLFSLQSAQQTFEKGGFPREIDYLFAAMAVAAGYEVRLVRNAGRDDILNTRIRGGHLLMNRISIGVNVGGTWRYFSPGNHHVPFDMLPWEDEAAIAFVVSRDAIEYETLPVSRADASIKKRVGRFVFDAEGTLDGTVEETITGHPAIELKEKYWTKSVDQCRKSLEEAIMSRLPTAEVSELTWERLNECGYPIVIRYHLRVPAYAGQVGERLLVAPSVFTVGQTPVFSAETRVHPIMFPYAYSEQDEVRIAFPEGFDLDQPSAPTSVGSPEDVVSVAYRVRVDPKNRMIYYKRTFNLDSPRILGFQVATYPALKSVFDGVHQSDAHAFIFKPVDADAVAK